MDFLRTQTPRLLLILALAALGAGLCAFLLPIETRAVADQFAGFPDSDIASHRARPFVLAGLCALPALACVAYYLGSTLDRYITRQFLGIFGICLGALFMIWLLIDLGDNISDFRRSEHILRTMGTFYGSRLPAVLLLLLPYCLLLALLYSLGKLSSSREIIAMIQSGRGVIRITLPLIIAGSFCTLLSLGLNYHWAPNAEGRHDEILAAASGKPVTEASKVLYRNPEKRRLWMIGAFPPDYQKGAPLLNVEITTTGKDRTMESRLYASHAHWNRESRQWTFENPLISHFRAGEAPVFEQPEGPLIVDSWTETPWQLIKPGLSPAYLGIPGLNTWLKSNVRNHQFADPAPYRTQWHYRIALPFTCLVTVLLATPLAIHFARRGPGGGIFLAVVLSALMMFFTNIVLAFGEAGLVPAFWAAWIPNISFTLLAAYLFRRRITGRRIYHSLRRLFPVQE